MSIEERFWSKVDKGDGCWLWTAFCDPQGYGRFRHPGGQLAHRFSYEMSHGPLQGDSTVDHLCFNRRCVRPEHLRSLPRSENASNQRQRYAEACGNGHRFTAENSMITKNPNKKSATGYYLTRRCRTCDATRKREWKARKRMTELSRQEMGR